MTDSDRFTAPNYIVWVDGVFHHTFTLEHARWIVENETKKRGAKIAVIYSKI